MTALKVEVYQSMRGRTFVHPQRHPQKEEPHVNIQRLTSLGSIALMVTAIGCGGSSDGKGKTGTGGGGDTGTGGTSGTGGTNGTGGSGAQSSEFSFSLAPTALMLPLGGMQTVTVTIDRDVGTTTFTDPLTFELDLPATITGTGLTAAFAPNPATVGSTTLTVDVGTTGIAAGNYTMNVVAKTGTGAAAMQYTVALPLKVTNAAATTLLVDADYSANNQDTTDVNAIPTVSDKLFPVLLQNESIAFNTFVVPAVGTAATTPASADLTGYSTVVWYTGNTYGASTATITPVQQAILESWLDQGGHTLILLSQNMVYDLYGNGNWTSETNTFLTNYVGAIGSAADGDLNHATYNVTGATATALAGKVFQVIGDQPITSSGDTINPATGTDVLGTVVSDADAQVTPAAAIPIVVGRKSVGTAGTSKIVYVGAPVENILVTAANNSAAQLFHGILVYLGLKTS